MQTDDQDSVAAVDDVKGHGWASDLSERARNGARLRRECRFTAGSVVRLGQSSMRATRARPNARLLSLRQAEAEYGLPYAQLLDLAKRGELAAVQPPHVRRIYIVRDDLERKLALWRIA